VIRLGLKLALGGGREALSRLIVVAASVIVGVTILLLAASGFHTLQAQSGRPCWECTYTTNQRPNVNPADTDALLWLYQDDFVDGRALERLELAALGAKAPVPPGIPRVPSAGQYYASPALIKLVRALPADELANRFPGQLIGTIGDAALSSRNQLVAFVGRPPSVLRQDPATITVRSIETAPEPVSYTTFSRLVYLLGAIGLLFPMIILISTAARLSASRREQRFAAMRLVGATSRQVSLLASIDALVGSAIGVLGGLLVFVAIRSPVARLTIGTGSFFIRDFTPAAIDDVLIALGVPILAVAGALLSLRRVKISPLGVSRRTTPPPPRAWRVLPLSAGIGIFLVFVLTTHRQRVGSGILLPVGVGVVLVMVGLLTAGPWLTAQGLKHLGKRPARASSLLAIRRLADNPRAAFRAVSGLVLAVFVGTMFATLAPAFDGGSQPTKASSSVSNALTVMFYDSQTAGLTPYQGMQLINQLTSIGHTTVIPIYAAQDAPAADRNRAYGLISCAKLQALPSLGPCPQGTETLQILTTPLVLDHSTNTLTGTARTATSISLHGLPLQAMLVTSSNGNSTIERARTILANQPGITQVPETFGEARASTLQSVEAVQRLVDLAIGITLLVAGCSLAVAVGGGLVERRRPFSLLRLAGMPLSVLNKVVLVESGVPLLAVVGVSAVTGFGLAACIILAAASPGIPIKLPTASYYLTLAVGLVAAAGVLGATLPLLGRMTDPDNVRFE
jgi:hypothetical protein